MRVTGGAQPMPEGEALPASLEAPVFPGDAADGAAVSGAAPAVQRDAARHGWRVLGILSALMGFASISTDVYLPAMPAIGLGLKAAHGMMEWTVSGYLIGFSFGQLLWGVLSDRYGRRRPIAAGLLLFILGSAGCALSSGAEAMIGWRIVQALGASASVVLSRAMVRDLYAGAKAAQMMSKLIIVMAIAPLLGPVAGGEILALSGWRAIFWALAAFGVLTLAALFTLPETLPPAQRNPQPLRQAFAHYLQFLKDRNLVAYAAAGGFFYGSVFAYIAGTPIVYIEYYHVSPRAYGLLFGAGVVGIMVLNLLNARLVHRLGSLRLLRRGAGIAALAGLLLAVNAWTGAFGLAGVAAPLFVFVSMNGLIVANSTAGALANFPGRAGMASALVGAAQYGSGIASSALVGAFADGSPRPMAAVIALTGAGCYLSARFLERRGRA